ncbi:MAG: response regulator [Nitrospira sp.]|nr:response regulator [Nitrospira sp.]
MSAILVVDGEPQLRLLYAEFLRGAGYRVRSARNGREALALAEPESPQMIVLSVDLPDISGIDVLGELRSRNFAGTVLLLAGLRDEPLLRRIRELGDAEVARKPCGLRDLARAVSAALARNEEARRYPKESRVVMERHALSGNVSAWADDLIHGRVR